MKFRWTYLFSLFVLLNVVSLNTFSQTDTKDPLTLQVDSLMNLAGILHAQNEDLVGALNAFQLSFELVENTNKEHHAVLTLYERYMKFLSKIGNYDESLKYGLEIIRITEKDNYTGDPFFSYHNAGKLYLKLNQPDSAIAIELRGIERAKLMDDEGLVLRANNELGLTYYHIGEYNKAVDHYTIAKYGKKPHNIHYLFVINENIVEALIKADRHDEARLLLDTMRIAPGRHENDRRNINYLFLEGEIALLKNNLNAADNYLTEAEIVLISSPDNKDHGMWYRLFEARTRYFNLTKDQNAIMAHNRTVRQFSDSLDLIQKLNIVSIRNNYYENQLENKDLKLENAALELDKNQGLLAQKELEKKNNILWFVGIILLLISVILAIIMIARRQAEQAKKRAELEEDKARQELIESAFKKQELENILQNKQKDISALSEYLMGSTEHLSDLRSMLRRLNHISDQQEKENMMIEFLSDARVKIQLFEGKGLALEHIETINEVFFAQLLKQHPKLTKGEKALCGFIKRGLTNKEIALEKNSTINTIKTAKNRLKKSLGLSTEITLYEYLSKI